MKKIQTIAVILAGVAFAMGVVHAQVSVPSTNVPMAIPDLGQTNSTLNFVTTTTNGVTDLDVQFDITHTWDSDVFVQIASPTVAAVTIMSNCGGSADNFTGTIISDQGAAADCSIAGAPFAGTFQAVQGAGVPNPTALAAFNGVTEQAGTWTLTVGDDSAICTGTLNAWSITLNGPPPLPVELMNFEVK